MGCSALRWSSPGLSSPPPSWWVSTYPTGCTPPRAERDYQGLQLHRACPQRPPGAGTVWTVQAHPAAVHYIFPSGVDCCMPCPTATQPAWVAVTDTAITPVSGLDAPSKAVNRGPICPTHPVGFRDGRAWLTTGAALRSCDLPRCSTASSRSSPGWSGPSAVPADEVRALLVGAGHGTYNATLRAVGAPSPSPRRARCRLLFSPPSRSSRSSTIRTGSGPCGPTGPLTRSPASPCCGPAPTGGQEVGSSNLLSPTPLNGTFARGGHPRRGSDHRNPGGQPGPVPVRRVGVARPAFEKSGGAPEVVWRERPSTARAP